jgi:predicted dehydrogenase
MESAAERGIGIREFLRKTIGFYCQGHGFGAGGPAIMRAFAAFASPFLSAVSAAPPIAVLVGTGFIGPVHVEALRRLGIPVRGVLGSQPARSREAAQRLGLEVAYGSLEEVLQDPLVRVVHLTSPNRFHREQALQALAAEKHVVCEKPLGMNATETAEMAAAAAARPDLVAAVNYNLRFYPLMLHARALIQQGELGEIFHVHGSYQQDWLLRPDDFNWRVVAEEGGALRAVGDIGTHWLDLAQFVTGRAIREVCADLVTVHPVRFRPTGGAETFSRRAGDVAASGEPVAVTTDDHASILLRCTGGVRGCVTVSQVSAGRKNCVRLEVSGSKQSLAWNSERPDELWIGHRDAPNQVMMRSPPALADDMGRFSDYPAGHAEGFPDTFKQLYRAIYADIEAGRPGRRPLYATFQDGHQDVLLCDAVLESHRSQSWVRIPGHPSP